jgi:hypothetical protein
VVNINKDLVYKKLDEDDITEIIIEYFQETLNNSELGRGILIGNAGKDLRFIGVFGNEDDPKVQMCDLIELDKEKEFNGDHAFLKNNPEFYL